MNSEEKFGVGVLHILSEWQEYRRDLDEDCEDFTEEATQFDCEYFDKIVDLWKEAQKS